MNTVIIFQIGDIGHLAESIMTKSFVNPRSPRFFEEKKTVCQFVSKCHKFFSFYNISFVYK